MQTEDVFRISWDQLKRPRDLPQINRTNWQRDEEGSLGEYYVWWVQQDSRETDKITR